MNIQPKQGNSSGEKGWLQEKTQLVLGLPIKIILASSLVVINYFSSRAQQKELRQLLQQVRDTDKANSQAKEDLFTFLRAFENQKTPLCPLMIKQYSAEEYQTGLLIHGELEWRTALKEIRQHLKLSATTSVSFFVGPHLLTEGTIITFFHKFKREDGILYVQYLELEPYG